MKKTFLYSSYIIVIILIFGCSKSKPTEEQIFNIINSESVIAIYDRLVLKKVIIKSTVYDGKKFQAYVNIEFFLNTAQTWMNGGQKDFIPNMFNLKQGRNSLDATAVFLQYDDDVWHLEGFKTW